MNKPFSYLFYLITLVCTQLGNAQTPQRYNSFHYSVNEGLLQSSIADIAIDQNNFCWISFPNGIQKFDGKKFTAVPIQDGLPDDKFVYFFETTSGDLLISHIDGISKYIAAANKFITLFTNQTAYTKPNQFIGEYGNSIYCYSEYGEMVLLDNKNYVVQKIIQTNLPNLEDNPINYTRFSSNIINHKIAIEINTILYLWDLQKNIILQQSNKIPNLWQSYLYLKTENEVEYLATTPNKLINNYNFTTQQISTGTLNNPTPKFVSRACRFFWQNKKLLSIDNRLFELNANTDQIENEIVNFQNEAIAGNLTIVQIKEDNFGNLILQTITGGIIKVIQNNFPLKYYGTNNTKENIVISILPDKKNNRILAGTYGGGLLVFDTLQHLIKQLKSLPGAKQPVSINSILQNKDGYILFISSANKICKVNYDFTKFEYLTITTNLPKSKSGLNYFGNTLAQNEKDALVQTQGHLYNVQFSSNKIEEVEFLTGYVMSGIINDMKLISHANDELIFFDKNSFKELKRVAFKNTGGVRCFAQLNTTNQTTQANKIYLGTNNGIYAIDSSGTTLLHITKENGLPDNCIYAMTFDEKNNLWCSTNKGIIKVNADNTVFQLTKEDGLQENEFNTNIIAKTKDGEIFFGGVNGISSFYPNAVVKFEEKINLFVTQIKINNKASFLDTAVWSITTIDLPYNENLLSFDFIAMGNNNPNQYQYQFKMEGIDKEWIQNNDLQTIRYFLPPGTYTLQLYASRFFTKDAKPLKQITIIIHAPYWKTWWFIILLSLVFASLLGIIVNQFNKRKFKFKMQEILSQQKIQTERERISRDLHDSVGAYANAVLYKTELLDNEIEPLERKELMQDLKFASKDIITSLRETVWALKKENYTAEDCLLRIRNFIQPLAKYYSNIHFEVEGITPTDITFHYTKALNLVRIIQEAVSNSIKHAEAKNIKVISSIENEKWKLTTFDDGIGFDYKTQKELESGNGLVNIERRAQESGFSIDIITGKNISTTICISI